jgi:glycosyltransferase involved in cell wall biosynthesis
MNSESISLIILCFNDGPSLEKLIPECHRLLANEFSDYEILVIDDGSLKPTKDILSSLQNSHPKLRIIEHETNMGVGATFQTGVKNSRYEIIAYIDGDSQYSPSDLFKLTNEMNSKSAVLGLRIKRADPLHRKFISFVFNKLIYNIYGLKFRDINSGIKVFPGEALKQILPIYSSGPFFDSEVLIKLKQNGIETIEIPVNHFPRQFGKAGGVSKNNIQKVLNEIIDETFNEYVRKNFSSKISILIVKILIWLIR